MIQVKRRPFVSAAIVGGLLVLAAGIVSLQRDQAVAQGTGGVSAHLPAPVLEVKQFMQVFNKPLYMDLKKDLKEKPDSDDDWKDIENDALQAAEIANLIAIRKVPQSAMSALNNHASQLQNASLGLAKASKAKDYTQAKQEWGHLVQACNACHKELAPGKGPQLEP